MKRLINIIKEFPFITLLMAFMLAELFIDPRGDFPLNDDWWYTQLYKQIFEDGQTSELRWVSTSLISQLMLTKPFALIFGYSYTALRFFTLGLSYLTIVFLYKICLHHLKLNQSLAFLLSAIVLFNPLFLCLSNSYMTDVPFLFLITGAVYFYFEYAQKNHIGHFVTSLLFFGLAILLRQIAMAFLPGLLIVNFLNGKKFDYKSLILFFVPILLLFCFENWLQTSTNIPGYNFVFSEGIKSSTSEAVINISKRWVHYLNISGFMLFPVLLPYLVLKFKTKEKIFTPYFILALVAIIPVIISVRNFPIGNYIYNLGIGPDARLDTYILKLNNSGNERWWWILIARSISVLGAFALILLFIEFLSHCSVAIKAKLFSSELSINIYLLVSLLFYYLFLSFTSGIFDRYILVFAVFCLLLFGKQLGSGFFNQNPVRMLLIILMVYSIAGTRDYLQLNRAKWEAICFLKDKAGVNNADINGGYEHAGSSMPGSSQWFLKWQNSPPSLYVISNGSLENYSVFKVFTYQRLMPFKSDTVFILKQNSRNAN